MSKFQELKDDDEGEQINFANQHEDFTNDEEDNLSLQSQDLEIGDLTKPKKKPGSGAGQAIRKSANLAQNAIMKKKEQVKQLAERKLEAVGGYRGFMDKHGVLIKATCAEFLVTLLFIFIVCAVAINTERSNHKDTEGIVVGALATGFASVALIYSFADVSGANFNPAVTFATIIVGKTDPLKGLAYMIAQLLASMFAMMFLTIVFPPGFDTNGNLISISKQLIVSPDDQNLGRALCMEIILSFILVYVIFAVAFDTVDNNPTAVVVDDDESTAPSQQVKKDGKPHRMTIYTTSGNSKSGFAPISIGFTLGFLCFLGGSVSGGAFNPARVFGPGICSWTWDYMWLYWLGDFTGAALAGLVQQKLFATKLKW